MMTSSRKIVGYSLEVKDSMERDSLATEAICLTIAICFPTSHNSTRSTNL